LSEVTTSGCVVWITGLSGAGKTTLALQLRESLRTGSDRVVLLDGDQLRETVSGLLPGDDSFRRDIRLALAYSYARLSRLLATQGYLVITATISLFHEIHQWNREHQPAYLEVFLEVPESELRARDSKGIYAGSAAGNTPNVAGVDVDVEFPLAPHILFTWDQRLTSATMATEVRIHLERAGFVDPYQPFGDRQ
jgi:adenylylsulfate kinase